jgi:predicted kinase
MIDENQSKGDERMQAIMLIGIQASGKSTFFKERFFNTHLRISNDLLKTKNREKLLLEFCHATQMPFVLDNTNPTKAVRAKYIELLRLWNMPVIGYYFSIKIERSLEWNSKREGKRKMPKVGILSTYKALEIPSYDEGFSELYYVDVQEGQFEVKEWKDEI